MNSFLRKLKTLFDRRPALFCLALFPILLPWILKAVSLFVSFGWSRVHSILLLMILAGGLAKTGNLLREEWGKIDE